MASSRLAVFRRQLSSLSSNASYRAAECQQLKRPLVITEKKLEPLEENQIRLKNKACGLNYATYLSTRGEYQVKTEPPFIPGTEIAGEVLEVGKSVTGVSPGDIVVGLVNNGGLQELITLDDYLIDMGAIYKLDPKVISKSPDFSKLASVMVNYGTAWMALTRKGLIKQGETVLVTGASGGVGLAAVELAAKLFKCDVIAVCRAEKAEQVRAYGAKHIIDYTKDNIRQGIKSIASDGVNIVFDTVGGDSATDLIKGLAYEGRYITIGYTAGIPKLPANILLLKSAIAVGLWWGNTMQSDPEVFKESVVTVMKLYLNGTIEPLVQQAMPLDKVNDAFDMIAQRSIVGKLVISF